MVSIHSPFNGCVKCSWVLWMLRSVKLKHSLLRNYMAVMRLHDSMITDYAINYVIWKGGIGAHADSPPVLARDLTD